MKRIFISRNLQPGSIFLQHLEAEGWQVHGESLMVFRPLPFDWPHPPDWIFFYSKHAVRFFFQQLSDPQYLNGVNIAVMGSGTAEELRRFHSSVDFIGSGEPEAVAAAFSQLASGTSVLFPRARQSRQSIQRLLKGRIREIDRIIYDNEQRTKLDLPVCQALVFTSPMNAEAYFRIYPLQEGQAVYAIGQITAQHLQQLGIEKVRIAKVPSEEGLAAMVLQEPPSR